MSILGYVSALLQLFLSSQFHGGPHRSPASSAQQDTPRTSSQHAAPSPAPSPQTEGLGQQGLVIESALAAQSGLNTGASLHGQPAGAGTGNAAGTQTGAQPVGASANAGNAVPPNAASSAAKGLEVAASKTTNATAQSVLEALLHRLATAAAEDRNVSAADLDAVFSVGQDDEEAQARHAAELRVAATRREAILDRVSAAADSRTTAQTDHDPARSDVMKTLIAQMTAIGASQGAYSTMSFAAIGLEAQRGQRIRIAL
ncbi:hypothetical protein [Rhodobacter lacus]|uniref:Uncharacterized protein n=1 Tax=Rhodobacter lacus TaxID=1641972 RepID=A0ABW5AAS3_9RHOB